MPKKPKIKSYEEYMKVAVEKAYGDTKRMTKEDWDNSVKERYDRGTNIYNYRIRDFANQSLMGLTGNATDTFNMLNRLDDIIEHEQDPKRKTLAMAVRRVTGPKMEEIIESSLFASVDTFYSEIDHEYDMSAAVKNDIANHRGKANRVISGHHVPGVALDTNNAELDDLPSSERAFILTTLIHTFMDNTAGKDPLGNVLPENIAMQELLHDVNVVAGEIADKAVGINSANYEPQTDREKKDFEALRAKGKNMNAAEKLGFTIGVKDAAGLASFTALGAAPNRTELDLTLEKNPIADITAEEFVRKQAAGTLSYSEIEWGESNIDHMLEGLYTIDELKALKRAGIDPAMGISADGEYFKWHNEPSIEIKNLSMLETAKKKCEIVSKAINGGKLDVCKFTPDGKGGYTLSNPMPIKTDLSMKTEKRSFWTWLKQLFGIEVSIKDKVMEANKAPREYQTESGREKFVNNAEINAEAMQMKHSVANELERINKFKNDTYDKVLNGTSLEDALSYTGHDGMKHTLFDTLGRSSSGVRLMQLYGMTKGYSFEEMCFDGGNVDRLALAREFMDEFGVMKYDEYAESKGLEQNDETRKQYNDYVSEKKEKVEMFCAKAYEKLREVEFPQVVDANDPMKFAANYEKMAAMGGLACDFSQMFECVGKNTLNPSDPAAKAADDRQAALREYTYYKVMPMQRITGAATSYSDFMKSRDYTNPTENFEAVLFNLNARTKSYLEMVAKETKGIRTWGELFDKTELCSKINGFGIAAPMPSPMLDEERANAHVKYVYSRDPAAKTVEFDLAKNSLIDSGNSEDLSFTINGFKNNLESAEAQMKPYFEMAEADPKLGFSEVYGKAVEKMNSAKESKKELLSEEISFDDLLSDDKQPVNKAPEKKEPEHSLNLGGMTK